VAQIEKAGHRYEIRYSRYAIACLFNYQEISMKFYILLLACCIPHFAMCDEVKKWVDESGQVHYGNLPPDELPVEVEKVEIQDSFDQQEYENAAQRNKETEQSLKEYETERKKAEKEAARAEAERRANIKQPPPLAGPSINLPPPEYTAPSIPGKPWLIPVAPEPVPLPLGGID
jgi:hypothetical protein